MVSLEVEYRQAGPFAQVVLELVHLPHELVGAGPGLDLPVAVSDGDAHVVDAGQRPLGRLDDRVQGGVEVVGSVDLAGRVSQCLGDVGPAGHGVSEL